MDNTNDKPEKAAPAEHTGLTAADAHETKNSSSEKPTSSSSDDAKKTGSDQNHEGSHAEGDWAHQATSKLYEAAASGWKSLAKLTDSAAHLPELAGFSLTDDKAKASKPADLTKDAPKPGETPAAKTVEQLAAAKLAETAKTTPNQEGMLSKAFNFLVPESVKGFFSGDKTTESKGLFENAQHKDPFENGTKTDPYFRGFAWADLGGAVAGAAFPTARFAFAGIEAGANLFNSNKASDVFKFDGQMTTGIGKAGNDSGSSGIWGYVSDTVKSVGEKVSQMFFSDDKATNNTPVKDAVFKGSISDGTSVSGLDKLFGKAEGDKGVSGSAEKGDHTVKVDAKGDDVTISSDGTKLHKGKNGTDITTADGRHMEQGKDKVTATSPKSDVNIERNADGTVKVTDKNGKPMLDFKNEGDAQRYFDNATIATTRPGESVEAAAARLKQENPNKALLITDGNGNTLVSDDQGNTMRRHPRGGVEVHHQSKDETTGKPIDTNLRITRHGQETKIEVRQKDGTYVDAASMTTEAREKALKGTGFKCHDDGHGHKTWSRRRTGDTQDKPAVDEAGNIQAGNGIAINVETGNATVTNPKGDKIEVVQKDGHTEWRETPAGQTEPTRVTTINADGSAQTQGKNPEDTIKVDAANPNGEPRNAHAWGIDFDREGTHIDLGGQHIDLNWNGNFAWKDSDGKDVFSYQDGEFHSDYASELAQELSEYWEERAEEAAEAAEIQAEQAIAQATSFASAIAAAAAGVVDPGAVGAMLAQLDHAVSALQAAGLSVPGEIFSARKQLEDVRPAFDRQVKIQGLLHTQAGHIDGATLVSAIRENTSPEQAVANILNRQKHQNG